MARREMVIALSAAPLKSLEFAVTGAAVALTKLGAE